MPSKPKMKKVIVIPADKNEPCRYEEVPDKLETYQKLVGGLIQPVNIGHGRTLWCNEEGIVLNLSPNPRAMRYYSWLQGDVYITGRGLDTLWGDLISG